MRWQILSICLWNDECGNNFQLPGWHLVQFFGAGGVSAVTWQNDKENDHHVYPTLLENQHPSTGSKAQSHPLQHMHRFSCTLVSHIFLFRTRWGNTCPCGLQVQAVVRNGWLMTLWLQALSQRSDSTFGLVKTNKPISEKLAYDIILIWSYMILFDPMWPYVILCDQRIYKRISEYKQNGVVSPALLSCSRKNLKRSTHWPFVLPGTFAQQRTVQILPKLTDPTKKTLTGEIPRHISSNEFPSLVLVQTCWVPVTVENTRIRKNYLEKEETNKWECIILILPLCHWLTL